MKNISDEEICEIHESVAIRDSDIVNKQIIITLQIKPGTNQPEC